MLELSRKRLEPFSSRVHILNAPLKTFHSNTFDRFISNYVLDLLSDDAIEESLDEAHRILINGGLLCVTTITHGTEPITRLVSWGWKSLFRINPSYVGGCRPVNILPKLNPAKWQIAYHNIGSQLGISSEIIVASTLK